jgi:putative FmdB family regulatory protein
MPIYEYRCQACGAQLEKLQKLSDPLLTECPECGRETLVKLVSASSFRLKGSGWYESDFKTGNKKNGLGESETKSDGDGKGDAKGEGKGEGKAEAAKADAGKADAVKSVKDSSEKKSSADAKPAADTKAAAKPAATTSPKSPG